jgi:hypothetical protein
MQHPVARQVSETHTDDVTGAKTMTVTIITYLDYTVVRIKGRHEEPFEHTDEAGIMNLIHDLESLYDGIEVTWRSSPRSYARR